MSAMTALNKNDGDAASYLDIVSFIRENSCSVNALELALSTCKYYGLDKEKAKNIIEKMENIIVIIP